MDTTTHKKHIGQLCRGVRVDALRWSIYKAMGESGLQRNQIRAIEAGDRDYTIDTLVRYCSALRIAITLNYDGGDQQTE